MSEKTVKWHETRNERERQLFEGKHFEILDEVSVEEGQEKFVSPLGYKLKSGFRVVQVTEDGGPTRALPFVVGKATLKRMHDVYNAVELPAPKKRGRPKKDNLQRVTEVLAKEAAPGQPHWGENEQYLATGVGPEASKPEVVTVSAPPHEDAQSGSQAGPTYDNPNAPE